MNFNMVPGNITAITLEDSGNTLVAGAEGEGSFYANTGYIAVLDAALTNFLACL